MTPGARVQAAIDVLDDILGGVPAEKALTGWARRSRFAGSKDRAAIRDHVFQALRCLKSYAALGGAETGRGVMIGSLRAEKIEPSELFHGQGHAPDPLTAEERAAGSTEPVVDIQDWVLSHLNKSLEGEDKAFEAANMLRQRAPVVLRVNLRKTTVGDAIAELAEDGVVAKPASIATSAVTVLDGARAITRTESYRNGRVELQDGSSQAAMERLSVATGASVLDYCAGGGGKVLALAARLDARWYAHDALPQRLKDLPDRARRADARVTVLNSKEAHARTYDLVLCDVPCSGSGTWRRTPDAKWRLQPSDLDTLTQKQDAILDRATTLVAPGGRLAYATCSLLTTENEERVDAFVARNSSWTIEASERWPISDAGDGFFLTQLKRI